MQATTRALSALRLASASRSALRLQGQRATITTSVRAPPKATSPPPASSSTAAASAPSSERVQRPNVSLAKIRQAYTRREPAEMATLLLRWDWLSPDEHRKLEGILEAPAAQLKQEQLDWLQAQFQSAKLYRSARSRLWVPDTLPDDEHQLGDVQAMRKRLMKAAEKEASDEAAFEDARRELAAYHDELKEQSAAAAAKSEVEAAEQGVEEEVAVEVKEPPRVPEPVGTYHRDRLAAFDSIEPEQRADLEYRSAWKALTPEQRSAAILRLRYDCLRRLGWRAGYTAGYPLSTAKAFDKERAERAAIVRRSGEGMRDDRANAMLTLAEADEAAAWDAWQAMSAAERLAEERSAWSLRDRSRLWIDDSSTSLILGTPAPRWYAYPPRAGILTFLPQESVKLVRNYVPPRQKYDAWKATFRIPLDMSRVALRNYLRTLYGLETTWVRIMVYRSQIKRTRVGYGKSAKGQRTWKKAEVGLLEPFIYPELSQGFRNEHLMQSDMEFERAHIMAKMTGRRRWRGWKDIGLAYKDEVDEPHLEHTHSTKYDGTWIRTNPKPKPKEGEEAEDKKKSIRPAVTTRRGGIETKRAKNILRTLGELRKTKEAAVAQKMEEIKADEAAKQDKK